VLVRNLIILYVGAEAGCGSSTLKKTTGSLVEILQRYLKAAICRPSVLNNSSFTVLQIFF
jgi:hypothetical protein